MEVATESRGLIAMEKTVLFGVGGAKEGGEE